MFYGRIEELRLLKETISKPKANLIVITGRRRIGKSTLIKQLANEDLRFLEFSGLSPNKLTTKQNQLDEFIRQLKSQTNLPTFSMNDWGDVFELLAQIIDNKKTIIFFDEISWMASKEPTFLGKLKNAWDLYFRKKNINLILCGSISTWIEKNILSSTGFFGRVSLEINLEPLPLHVCNDFWGTNKNRISAYDKLKVFAITGGIPRYLEEINPKDTSEKNIQQLCFKKEGVLFNEFERIFNDLYNKKAAYFKDLISKLIYSPKKLNDIFNQLNKSKNVSIIQDLENLQKSGFISRDYTWLIKNKKVSKLSKYRISDNYVRFYLKYILPNKHLIDKNLFKFQQLSLLQKWQTIMGLQFENLVINNFAALHKFLEISEMEVLSSNPYFQNKTTTQDSCQIDYLIHTKFNNLYVCEIKFSRNPIGNLIIKEMEQKIKKIKRPKGYSIRPILITANGATEELESEQYFDKIINFDNLLNL